MLILKSVASARPLDVIFNTTLAFATWGAALPGFGGFNVVRSDA
ncbi:MAG: hypothetical protein U0559_05185 [Anaerolineae bacterium]